MARARFTGTLHEDRIAGVWRLEWDEGCGVDAEFARRHLAVQFCERRGIDFRELAPFDDLDDELEP